jgi:hypothetical protein
MPCTTSTVTFSTCPVSSRVTWTGVRLPMPGRPGRISMRGGRPGQKVAATSTAAAASASTIKARGKALPMDR